MADTIDGEVTARTSGWLDLHETGAVGPGRFVQTFTGGVEPQVVSLADSALPLSLDGPQGYASNGWFGDATWRGFTLVPRGAHPRRPMMVLYESDDGEAMTRPGLVMSIWGGPLGGAH